MKLGILFPVLNEKLRLKNGIENTIEFLDNNLNGSYDMTIVDNGSTDETPEIAKGLCERYPQVKYICTKEKGVGLAFREGVKVNKCEIIGYMDVDLSTDIKHLKEVINIFENDNKVSMVNGSRFSMDSETTNRKWYRNITSFGLIVLLKLFLKMKSSDAICGFKFFRKEAAEKLINEAGSDNGWFYIIELLLRAERNNMKIIELPVVWVDDQRTKVKVFKLVKYYTLQIIKLRGEFNEEDKKFCKE